PLHVHRTEDEVFYVLEGEFRFRVGDQDLRAGQGETLLAPKGVPHSYLVESERGRWLAITVHGDFEGFVRSLGRPAERPELPEPSPPPNAGRGRRPRGGRLQAPDRDRRAAPPLGWPRGHRASAYVSVGRLMYDP